MLTPSPPAFQLVRYAMAIWTTLDTASASEDGISCACACAACGAFSGQSGAALQPLEDADANALPSREAEADAPRDARIAGLARLSQHLADIRADEKAWLDFTSSEDFLAFQDDPHLIDWLAGLSSRLYPEMASALYTAYGFASSRAIDQHPACGRLRQSLMAYCQLIAEDIPLLSQKDILRLTASCVEGILALQKEPQSVHLWQQVFQLPDFLILRHQPHFLLALGRAVDTHRLSGECLLTLAEACTEGMRLCPCAEALARRLPSYRSSQGWSSPELFAGHLLQGGAGEFFEAARNKIFFLLERTAENFRHSVQRHPWDYVFARPQFPLVKRDPAFLERLMAFHEGRELPLKFWQSLHDAYLEDFLKLKETEKDSQLWRLRELVRSKLMEKQGGQDASPRFRLSPPLLGAASALYLIAALWISFQEPLLGIPLLLAPLALLFF